MIQEEVVMYYFQVLSYTWLDVAIQSTDYGWITVTWQYFVCCQLTNPSSLVVNYMYYPVLTLKALHISHTHCICVPYDSYNRQLLFLQASVNYWFFNGQAVFSVCSKFICFFQRLKDLPIVQAILQPLFYLPELWTYQPTARCLTT